MPLIIGTRLASHEIVGFLGAGGMGEVYLALDTKLNRRVAIKVLPDVYGSDAERVARFQREAQAVAALNHANIAAIYDFAEADAIRFLVLELVEGDTLADRIARGAIRVDETLQIAKQILEALEAAHEKGICHRDLKPANVKLTADGAVKVLDFGLAKFLQTDRSPAHLTHSPTLTLAATIPGVVLGTAGYMSPEQAKGFEADQRSDIFSFGCILFEMLTGRRAFEGDTVSEILASVLKSEVDYSLLPPRLNPRLVEVLHRCLEKNPKKRYHAAADVRVEIEGLIGRGVVVEEPRTIQVRQRPLWRRLAALGATGVVAAAGAGYLTWMMKPEPVHHVARFTLSLPKEQVFTNPGRHVVQLSPDGTNLVYVANQRLFLRPMSGLEARVIPGSELGSGNDAGGGLLNPVFSPDGQWLAFFSQKDLKLKRIRVGGGDPVTICAATAPLGMSWSQLGILFGQVSKGIMHVSPDGGEPTVLVAAGEDEVPSTPQLLPDGRTLLFAVKKRSESWEQGLIVVQASGGERKTLVSGGANPRYLPTGHLVYARGGSLLAVRFDPGTLKTSGGSVPVVEGVSRPVNQLTQGGTGIAQFSYSDDGTLAYVPGPVGLEALDMGSNLAIFDGKGGNEPLKLLPGSYTAPRVTRDGKMVAFERTDTKATNIFTFEPAGNGSAQQLTFDGNNRAPVWSPDGQWLAFQSDREGDNALFKQRADGSGKAERLSKPEAGVSHTPQSWSPDSAYLVFTTQKESDPTLQLLSLKDGKIAPFGDMRSREATFSPDGKWIAYLTRNPDANGGPVVFIEPFPRTGAQYKVPFTGGHLNWSPKGDGIVMNTGPGQSTSLAISTSPTFRFGQPQPFDRRGRLENNPASSRRNADMMPDGRLLGVLSAQASAAQDGGAAQEITMVLNWFEDVRQRLR